MSTASQWTDVLVAPLQAIVDEINKDKERLSQEIVALKAKQKEIDTAIRENEKVIEQVDTDVAVGLKHAAKNAGVAINLVNDTVPKNVNRLTPKATDSEIESVLTFVIPLQEKHALSIGEIRAKTKFDRREMEWIIGRLLKGKKIQKIGKGNQTKYFKVGKQLKQG